MNYTEITTYEQACALVGTTPEQDLPYADPQTPKQHWLNTGSMLETINEAINMQDGEKWDRDPKTTWYQPEFYRDKSGFGFSDSDAYYWNTNSTVGARLSFRDRSRCDHGRITFKALYEAYHLK